MSTSIFLIFDDGELQVSSKKSLMWEYRYFSMTRAFNVLKCNLLDFMPKKVQPNNFEILPECLRFDPILLNAGVGRQYNPDKISLTHLER